MLLLAIGGALTACTINDPTENTGGMRTFNRLSFPVTVSYCWDASCHKTVWDEEIQPGASSLDGRCRWHYSAVSDYVNARRGVVRGRSFGSVVFQDRLSDPSRDAQEVRVNTAGGGLRIRLSRAASVSSAYDSPA